MSIIAAQNRKRAPMHGETVLAVEAIAIPNIRDLVVALTGNGIGGSWRWWAAMRSPGYLNEVEDELGEGGGFLGGGE